MLSKCWPTNVQAMPLLSVNQSVVLQHLRMTLNLSSGQLSTIYPPLPCRSLSPAVWGPFVSIPCFSGFVTGCSLVVKWLTPQIVCNRHDRSADGGTRRHNSHPGSLTSKPSRQWLQSTRVQSLAHTILPALSLTPVPFLSEPFLKFGAE